MLGIILFCVGLVLAVVAPNAACAFSLNSYVTRSIAQVGLPPGQFSEGPVIGLILPSCVMVLCAIYMVRQGRQRRLLRAQPVDLLMLGFGGIMATSILWSPDPIKGAEATARYMWLGILPYYLVPRILQGCSSELRSNIEAMSIFLVTGPVVAVAYAYARYTNPLADAASRTTIGSASVIQVATLFGQCVIVGLYALQMNGSTRVGIRILRALGFVCSVTSLLGLILAATRGPIFSMMISLPWILVHMRRGTISRIIIVFLVLLGIVASFSFLLKPLVARATATSGDVTARIRMHLYERAEHKFEMNWMLGAGTASWSLQGTYPHNIVLECLSDYGVIGVAVPLAILLTLCSACRKGFENGRGGYVMLWSALTAYAFVESNFSGTIFHHKYLFYNMGMLVGTLSRWDRGLCASVGSNSRV